MTYVNNSNTWYAKAGTISNTGAIYCGSDLHIANSVNSGYDNGAAMCYDKDSDRFVCISRVSSNLHQWLCSRTGTTVVNQHQNGSPSNITGSVGSSMVGIAYDEVNKKFFIIAGEPSGDLHGAALIKEIRKCEPNSSFIGHGGINMKNEGMEIIINPSYLKAYQGS